MKRQTIATEKWQKANGYTVKSFKLKQDVVKQFEEACKVRGTSQAAAITELMNKYINDTKGA